MSGFEIVGLIGAVNSTLSLTKEAVEKIKAYRSFDEATAELSLHLKTDQETLDRILVLLKPSTHDPDAKLSEDEKRTHLTLYAHLESVNIRLRGKVDGLPPAVKASFTAKSAWALWRKKEFEGLEKGLYDWLQRIHLILSTMKLGAVKRESPTERLQILVSSFMSLSTQESTSSLEVINENQIKPLSARQSKRMCCEYTDKSKHSFQVICEYRTYPDKEAKDAAKPTICELVEVLSHGDYEQTGILKCKGSFTTPDALYWGLCFQVPRNLRWHHDATTGAAKLLSLKDLLLKPPRFSLSQRLRFATELARSILYIHLIGWVHKSIRPENVVFLEKESSAPQVEAPTSIPKPVLFGYDVARNTASFSDQTSDTEWRNNIYRHPKRQFGTHNASYTMAHDVYSLGVILLEIGMWGSNGFRPFEKDERRFKEKTGDQLKSVLEGMMAGLPAASDPNGQNKGLAVMMGDKYVEITKYCLGIGESEEVGSSAFAQDVWLRLDLMRSSMRATT
ncbi:hypothetical protein BDZ45DRAFT_417368 [Acephala macrosclerotiorum]|nr:hypothetical protein BDZ45DRAFT_417368 [Acephala macrosclerotiorum]